MPSPRTLTVILAGALGALAWCLWVARQLGRAIDHAVRWDTPSCTS